MAFKRRRLGSTSLLPASSFSQISLVPRSSPASSPGLPTIQRRNKAPSRPLSSSASERLSLRAENNVVTSVEETEAEVQLREESDCINEAIMAIDMKAGAIGCAYYVARDETLYLMQDIKSGVLDIVDTLKLHAQPTTIVISTRSEEKLEEHISKEARRIDRGGEESKPPLSTYPAYLFTR